MSSTKRITLGLSAVALALGSGLGITGMASAATAPAPTPGTSAPAEATPGTSDGPRMHGGHGHGGDRGQVRASDLAAKLGVDETKVTEALKAHREASKSTTPPAGGTKPDAALAGSLASALGVEESKVAAALGELRAAARTDRAAALKTRLDEAVTEGTLTRTEADAVTKAVEKGVIGGGGH